MAETFTLPCSSMLSASKACSLCSAHTINRLKPQKHTACANCSAITARRTHPTAASSATAAPVATTSSRPGVSAPAVAHLGSAAERATEADDPTAHAAACHALEHWDDGSASGAAITQRTLETWLESSAPDIIRHLHEAPFFHLVYDRPDATHRHHAPAARRQLPAGAVEHPDSWTAVRRTVAADNPDGLILVHRLDPMDLSKRFGKEMEGVLEPDEPAASAGAGAGAGGSASATAPVCQSGVWGLVVLGRASQRHACYILKTTRCTAGASSASMAATRFSITRAKCFGPSVHQQLESAWLTAGR